MAHYANHGHIRLHYLAYGPADAGQTVIFLPGLTANAFAVAGLVDAGLADGRRVRALDFRARGLSDAPATGYRMADYVGDVLALMDAAGVARAVVAGHSFGALVGTVLAAKHPARVSHLIMIDSSPLLITERTRRLIKGSLDRLGRPFPSADAYLDAMRQAPFLRGYWDDALAAYFGADVRTLPDGTAMARTPASAIDQTIDAEFDEPWLRYMADTGQPVLLLHAPDGYGPPGAAPILSADMARTTVEMLPRARYRAATGNHITMLFGPHARATVDTIIDFLSHSTSAAGENI